MGHHFHHEPPRAWFRQYEDEPPQEAIEPRAPPTRKSIAISSEAGNGRCEVVGLPWGQFDLR
jgi:hypothetical protein